MKLMWLVVVLCPLMAMGTSPGPAPNVAIVYGERSVKAGDVGYSRAMARDMGRWMVGVAEVFPDSKIKEALARPRTVAHLLSLAEPPADVLAEIDKFLARGGKIVVYNTGSAELSRRVGVEPRRYLTVPSFGEWAGFRFSGSPPLNAPAVVRQMTNAIRESAPIAGGGAVVIAMWENREGRSTGLPALYRHPNGFWMSSLLLENDTGESRRRLVSALTCALAPELWAAAQRRMWEALGYERQVAALRAACPPARRQALERVLAEAEMLAGTMRAQVAQRAFAGAVATVWQLRQVLREARSAEQLPWPGSVRAVWDHGGYGLAPGKWEETCAALAMWGITDVFVLAATPTVTHATVPGLRASRLRRDCGDQLAQAVRAAKPHGIRVHAYIFAFNASDGSAEDLAALRKAGRLMTDAKGQGRNWLDARLAVNRERVIETARHLAANYDIAGIHLDYIRYPDFSASMDEAMRRDFERRLGKRVARWPEDVTGSASVHHKDFIAYRVSGVNETVRGVSEMLRSRFPNKGLVLTAAEFGGYPLCVDSVAQDWGHWLRQGWLDTVYPMNYSASMETYKRILDGQATAFPAPFEGKSCRDLASRRRSVPSIVIKSSTRSSSHRKWGLAATPSSA